MINEQERYVSPEVAELLKEKDFNWKCYDFYEVEYDQMVEKHSQRYSPTNWNDEDDDRSVCYSRPTQQMAMDWVRGRYGITISVVPTMIDQNPDVAYEALIWINKTFDRDGTSFVGEYGEVVDDALKWVLTKLV